MKSVDFLAYAILAVALYRVTYVVKIEKQPPRKMLLRERITTPVTAQSLCGFQYDLQVRQAFIRVV